MNNYPQILPGISIVDLGLLIDETLIIGDIHVGYEEALNKQGIFVPRMQAADIKKRLSAVVEAAKPKRVILNGDVKHEFGTISNQEWRDALMILDYCASVGGKVTLVKGNHDTILGPIAEKRNVDLVDHVTLRNGEIYICHGHTIPDNADFKNAKIVIIGHEHPAVSIRDTVRAETYKCFLLGTYKRKTLVVMPSFNLVTDGTDVLQEQLLSPFLHQNLRDFEVWIAGDRTYHFGKIKNLR